MKIVLDLQAAQSESRYRGIGRYSLSLARALIRNAGQHEITVALDHVFPDTIEPLKATLGELLPEQRILVYRTLPRSISNVPENAWRNRAGQLIRESFLASLGADVVHCFSMFEGWGDDSVVSSGCLPHDHINSVTLYDLIPLSRPERYLQSPEHKAWYQDQLDSMLRSDLLLGISEHTRRTAIELLDFPESDIDCVSADADPIFSPVDPALPAHQLRLQELGVRAPFIMYTGVISREDPRKNFGGLLQAYGRLPTALRQDYQLVLVGRYNAYDQHDLTVEASRLGIDPEQLLFTDRVSDSDLVLLYSACELFVFPSLEEGFGLPALEAMRCGAVVIGSNSSSIPEVIANPDALFDPHSIEDMARTMERALTDEAMRQSIVESSTRQSAKFSWDQSALAVLAAFERKLAQRSGSKSTVSAGSLARQENTDGGKGSALYAGLQKLACGEVEQQDIVFCAQAIAENHCRRSPRRLYLDVSVLVHIDAKTGIQRVVRNLSIELTRTSIDGAEVQFVYLDEKGDFRVAAWRKENPGMLQRRPDDELLDVASGDVYVGLDLDLEGFLVDHRNRFLSYHRRRGLRVYYLVYDLLPILQIEHFHAGIKERFPLWLNYVVSQADGLLCISRAVADELLAWLQDNPPTRILPLELGYFHLGAELGSNASAKNLPDTATEVLRQLRRHPALLMVGTVEPRKGQQQALDAVELLWREGVDVILVLVGKSGWNMEPFEKRLNRHPELGERLFWLQGISDEMLDKVYEESAVLLAASTGEGFGLPLIEAAEHGLPILARELPVFREVAGEHATFFIGDTADELAAAIQRWLENFRSGDAIPSAGIQRLSWQQSARQFENLVLGRQQWYASWSPQAVAGSNE